MQTKGASARFTSDVLLRALHVHFVVIIFLSCAHTDMYACVCVCVCVRARARLCLCVCVHIHIYVYIYCEQLSIGLFYCTWILGLF